MNSSQAKKVYPLSTHLKCYSYFDCTTKDCKMFGRKDDTKCWETQGTLCNHPSLEVFESKSRNKCDFCIYYKAMNNL